MLGCLAVFWRLFDQYFYSQSRMRINGDKKAFLSIVCEINPSGTAKTKTHSGMQGQLTVIHCQKWAQVK
jgi:hypothetical protein